ncbi:MAG: GHMP kinase [Thermoprotei archaeon]|nr:MAG: GHMP kinase [Thermoprotei archaeon]
MLSSSALHKAVELFRELFHSEPQVVVSAPGRLDFLNTHQDYKGLPVVSVGVNLRTYVALRTVDGDEARVASGNLRDEGVEYLDVFSVSNPVLRGGRWFGDYLRASVRALLEKGSRLSGFEATIYSDVPVAAGLASSAALEVSFIAGLSELFSLGLSRRDIAELAYHAEHDIMGIPCGRLDQYGSAYGGIVKIETRPPYRVEELPRIPGVFVVMDSGIRHSTADIHPRRQADIDEGLRLLLEMEDLPPGIRRRLGRRYYEPRWEELSLEELKPYLDRLPDRPRRRILFTLLMHRSTTLALDIIRGRIPSTDTLVGVLGNEWRSAVEKALASPNPVSRLVGVVMDYQHELLRDLYDLSLPQLERIRDAAKDAGALGVKISGAGLGGSLIALVESPGVAEKVLEAARGAGAVRGWIVEIDRGVSRERG